jgi:mono/diheme cytochrome c family protein
MRHVRLLAAATSLALLAWALPQAAGLQGAAPAADKVARGKYLATLGGCHDCHTPKKLGPQGPEPDMSRALSGHPEAVKAVTPPALSEPWLGAMSGDLTAWAGPWGISYAFNLTPDENTGIGIWTEEMFIKAMRTGRHMGTSRPILPPMPWQSYAQLTDDDLKALWAYLRSLPKVKNRVPEPVPPKGGPAKTD